VRLSFEGRRVLKQERLLLDYNQSIRDVRQGPDGWLYLLTDSDDGRVVRLER
jgi:glucose/arabinose dehydrogenase